MNDQEWQNRIGKLTDMEKEIGAWIGIALMLYDAAIRLRDEVDNPDDAIEQMNKAIEIAAPYLGGSEYVEVVGKKGRIAR